MRNFKITVDGSTYEVAVEEMGGDSVITSAPAHVSAPAPKPAVNVANGTKLNAPMPGTILSLAVSNGASVKKGDKVLVLEAMKMENDITANADGVITFSINNGATVESGDVLAVIA